MCTYKMYKMFKFCIDTTKLLAFCVYLQNVQILQRHHKITSILYVQFASLILNISEKKSINFNITVSHTAIHIQIIQ